jgi:hypothetical protein
MAKATTATRKIAQDITFLWQGRDKRGRRVTGKSTARDDKALRVTLRTQGIAPLSVRKQSTSGRRGKVTPEDIAVFSRQTATMLAAGIPLVQGFEIVGSGLEKASMQKLVQDLRTDIEGGSSLRETLARRPQHFSELYVNLVAAGEQADQHALDDLVVADDGLLDLRLHAGVVGAEGVDEGFGLVRVGHGDPPGVWRIVGAAAIIPTGRATAATWTPGGMRSKSAANASP